MSTIKYISFPSTQPPPSFINDVHNVFMDQEEQIGTMHGHNAKSNNVLLATRPGLIKLGYLVEGANPEAKRINRPVYFGENGSPSLNYQVDAYHSIHKCGIEIEAGRATRSNAVYRDLIQAMIMTQIDHLVIAVPHIYRYNSSGRPTESRDYDITVEISRALFGHDRISIPFGLTVLGY